VTSTHNGPATCRSRSDSSWITSRRSGCGIVALCIARALGRMPLASHPQSPRGA
jgi:hypothetical protein